MKLSIPEKVRKNILSELQKSNNAFQKLYPGESPDRQPVHTVYGGAHLFKSDTALKMGDTALKHFQTYAPDFSVLANVLKLPGFEALQTKDIQLIDHQLNLMTEKERKNHFAWLPFTIYLKVIQKLKTEPVEDFRIDFEDGYGNRSDKEEDDTALTAALEVVKGMKENTLPPFIGIRIKPFTEDFKERGIKTLDIFITALSEANHGNLPANFVVMLPKVSIPQQVTALTRLFKQLEENTKLKPGSLKMEMMIETTQSVINYEGKIPLRTFIEAGKGRFISTAFGTYDYTAANNITAKYQDMGHPVCDFAHLVMKAALGNTGIPLSDGATNVMPVGPHRGKNLTSGQLEENKLAVHRAWKIGYDHIRHSLYKGLYQGWDLNPAQIPIRYAAVYSFFLESFDDASIRLKKFIDSAARATLTGGIFDDAATGQGLLNYFLRALNCGAITEEETLITGLTMEEIKTRSFFKILQNRRKSAEKHLISNV